jgi:smad nuclear-interacting protein 1
VQLKYSEPSDTAHALPGWKLFVFKGNDMVQKVHIDGQSSYLIGKDEIVCDISILHASCSKQHAVLQYRKDKPYPSLMDLKSTNKTHLNGNAVDSARYYELRHKDIIRFGESSREYVVMQEQQVD